MLISYLGLSHVLRNMEPIMQAWSAFYYAGHWFCIIAIILAAMLPKVARDKKPVTKQVQENFETKEKTN